MDNCASWDFNVGDHVFHILEFLTTCGNNGVIQNPGKFQFCKKEVEFCGYRITADGIVPSPETINAIREFPRPNNITDVRSLFGLVEQVAFCFAKSKYMEPFRNLLNSKEKFHWNQALQDSFECAKREITAQVEQGVKTYVQGKPTGLVTDWSRSGIGYILMQKHCQCSGMVVNCCEQGWKTIAIGSRFLTDAESKYAEIVGELLGIAWALEKIDCGLWETKNLLCLQITNLWLGFWEIKTLT